MATESYAFKLLRDSLTTSIRSVASRPNATDRAAATPFPELATWLGIEHGLALRTPSLLHSHSEPLDAATPIAQVVRHSEREPNLAQRTPRAWFAAAVVAEPDDLRFDQLRSASDWQRAWRSYLLQRSSPQAASPHPTTIAWRECPAQYASTPRRPEVPPALELLVASNGRLALAAQTPEPRLLVLAERFDPDWRVRVVRADGEESIEAVAGRVNWICRGVWLPPGEWRVELEYRPRWLFASLGISLMAWCGWLSWWLYARTSRES